MNVFDKLTESIKNHNLIILMTHARPDLDGMGSACALKRFIESLGRNVLIVKPKIINNYSLERAINLYSKDFDLNFTSEDEILKMLDKESLVIVLDTNSMNVVESPKVIDRADNIIVIDHHCKMDNLINSTVMDYEDDKKSSVVEMIAEYLKYNGFKLDKITLTMLLAGMEIDTNTYNLKTTENTFKMAGYLVGEGADLILKQELLKEPKEEKLRRYAMLKDSYEIANKMHVCVLDDEVYSPVDLSLIANDLLSFDGVKAAFTIGRISDDTIGVSARSMGDINVGAMMLKLGGGGHLASAATQIRNKSKTEIIDELTKVIEGDEYESNTTQRC